MFCVRALVRALNDAKNYAQQGCAMQFDGITLTHNRSLDLPETLNYSEKAVENCLFLAVTITLVAAL